MGNSRAMVAILLAAGLVATTAPARAAVNLYPTAAAAQTACQGDAVVWIDLNRGQFFPAFASVATVGSGGYGCLLAARVQYREFHG